MSGTRDKRAYLREKLSELWESTKIHSRNGRRKIAQDLDAVQKQATYDEIEQNLYIAQLREENSDHLFE